jgi:cell division protein ZapA (FtsZ GTPase activity inhibitor)
MKQLGKNRIRLNICGCECALCSEDSENYIRSVGDEVQKAMDGIMEKNERISVTMAAIITALSYCDDSHKAASSAENLRTQIKDYLEDSSRARMEAEEAKRELERLKRENQTLRARLAGTGEPGTDGVPDEKKPPLEPSVPAPRSQTGDFSRVGPETPADQEGFMSFFEKKTDEP